MSEKLVELEEAWTRRLQEQRTAPDTDIARATPRQAEVYSRHMAQ